LAGQTAMTTLENFLSFSFLVEHNQRIYRGRIETGVLFSPPSHALTAQSEISSPSDVQYVFYTTVECAICFKNSK
jgi:hypothetical protein